jgi:hypothetical protein
MIVKFGDVIHECCDHFPEDNQFTEISDFLFPVFVLDYSEIAAFHNVNLSSFIRHSSLILSDFLRSNHTSWTQQSCKISSAFFDTLFKMITCY